MNNQAFSKIWIVIIILILIAGGILAWQYLWQSKLSIIETQERKVIVPSSEKDCQNIGEIFYRNNCYIDLAKNTENEALCEKIESLPPVTEGPDEDKASTIANCYVQLAVIKHDSLLCEKAEAVEKGAWRMEFSDWCKEYFSNPSNLQTYNSDKYGFKITLPKDWKCDNVFFSQGGYFQQTGINCAKITNTDDIKLQILKSEQPYYFGKEKVTFDEFIIRSQQYLEEKFGSVQQEEILLNNLPAKKLSFKGMEATHYLIEHEINGYEILAEKGESMFIVEGRLDSSKLDIYKPIFYQMLSTFRFLE